MSDQLSLHFERAETFCNDLNGFSRLVLFALLETDVDFGKIVSERKTATKRNLLEMNRTNESIS